LLLRKWLVTSISHQRPVKQIGENQRVSVSVSSMSPSPALPISEQSKLEQRSTFLIFYVVLSKGFFSFSSSLPSPLPLLSVSSVSLVSLACSP
jgi:hypothetical protein